MGHSTSGVLYLYFSGLKAQAPMSQLEVNTHSKNNRHMRSRRHRRCSIIQEFGDFHGNVIHFNHFPIEYGVVTYRLVISHV